MAALEARRYGNALVLRLAGRLDQENSDSVRAELSGPLAAAGQGETAVLDLSGVEYVSSAGLRCLMLASRQVKSQGGRIAVAALQPMVAEIFAISHFDRVLEVFPTVRDALAAASAEAVAAFGGG